MQMPYFFYKSPGNVVPTVRDNKSRTKVLAGKRRGTLWPRREAEAKRKDSEVSNLTEEEREVIEG